jgi:uncharacterized protein (DUF2384 family)
MPLPRLQTDADAGAVLSKAVVRAAADLEVPQRVLARMLGTSEATVSRLARGRALDPSSKEGELAIQFLRVFRSLDALVGGNREHARAWLHAENAHLGGRPVELVQTALGLVQTAEYLDALRGR